MKTSWTWWVLSVLLVLLGAAALFIDRGSWPALVGDEATYLMQAESLAWDWDLFFEEHDYERFLAHRSQVPEGLILQSGDAGSSITYGKPFFYGLYLAPFVRAFPRRGPLVANALLLAIAALLAARTLSRRMGPSAPLWVSALIFGSVTFAYTFWVHPDLFLMCLTALALALALDPRNSDEFGRWELARWALVGLLLAVVAYSRPMYAVLFLPAVLAVPRERRRRLLPTLVAGAIGLMILAGLVHQSLSGSWTSYGAARRGFYSYTGFPGVDFPASEWQTNLQDWGNHAWLKPSEVGLKKVDASLLAWNTVYFLVGRHVGFLPYFLPVVLVLLARPRGAVGWSLVLILVVGAAAFLWLRPFNFWGGGGAIANRYILPLYPALWFMPSKPIRVRWILVALVVSALFVGPLWRRPLAFPLMDGGSYRYVSSVARGLLPHETTQSHLKPSGREDVWHQGLWIKFLDRGVDAVREGEVLRLRDGDGTGHGGAFLVGSGRPLTVLELEMRLALGAEPPKLDGGTLRELESRGAWRRFEIILDTARARHPMWWTWDPFSLYSLRLIVNDSGEKPVAFKIRD